MDLSLYPWYNLQFHQEGHSPYLYEFAHDQWLWIEDKTWLYMDFSKQIDTINVNKANYTCYEDNSNSFMHCMEEMYSKKLGCILPWALRNDIKNDSMNLCEGKEKFKEFKNISMNILKSEASKELTNKHCFIPNCMQRSWQTNRMKTLEKRKNNSLITGFKYDLPRPTKVLVRKEVNLYTVKNAFAEVGGYLGLLLGESLFSYLIAASKWFQILKRKFKECCRKADEEPESSTA